MNRILIENIKVKMATVLTSFQMNKLDQVLAETFTDDLSNINKDFIKLFIYAKKSEGKSIKKCGMFNDIKSYPHKFRRTFATKAIDKGMPIEQVQVLLGHTEIDTTLRYA